MSVRVDVASSWNKMRKKLKNLHDKSQISSSYIFSDLNVHKDGKTDGHG